MSIVWRVSLAVVLLFGGTMDIAAQVRGGGSAEEPLTARVIADVFRERTSNDSVVYLIVLWRGQEFWTRKGGGGSAMSSRGDATVESGATLRQTITRAGIARTVEFDRNTQRVVINSRDTVRATRDSTLVVMVDRVDNIGGAPAVSAIKIPRLAAAAIYIAPPTVMPSRDEYTRLLQEFALTGRVDNKFSQFLATIPGVREFLR